MTCIVAISDGERVWMGSDSRRNRGEEIGPCTDSKLWTHENQFGSWAIGFAGVAATAQVMKYMTWPDPATDIDPVSGDPEVYVASQLMPDLRKTMKESGRVEIKNGLETFECNLLIGIKGVLFDVDGGFGVSKISRSYAAWGSGGAVALGSLGSTERRGSLDPKERLQEALELAAEVNRSVGPPFHFIEV